MDCFCQWPIHTMYLKVVLLENFSLLIFPSGWDVGFLSEFSNLGFSCRRGFYRWGIWWAGFFHVCVGIPDSVYTKLVEIKFLIVCLHSWIPFLRYPLLALRVLVRMFPVGRGLYEVCREVYSYDSDTKYSDKKRYQSLQHNSYCI